MNQTHNTGFTLTELVVIVVLSALLLLCLLPALSNNAVAYDSMVEAVRKGRDIYAAITSANVESRLLGTPSLWPSDTMAFSNSTAYFRFLTDEAHMGTPEWVPKAPGFDYTKLAGAGVPLCPNSHLTPKYNMWTIACNVHDDLDGTLPVLVTRNVDATSLASPATVTQGTLRVRFDDSWHTPWGDWGFVLVRKDGTAFKARRWHLEYDIIYMGARLSRMTGGMIQRGI